MVTNVNDDSSTVHQNRHGVDLREVAEADAWPAQTRGGRTTVGIEEANVAEDEFVINATGVFDPEPVIKTVDGDAFYPIKTEVGDPITDDELAELNELVEAGEDVRVKAYIQGHEIHMTPWVQNVDLEAGEVHVRGEYSAQTINRTVDRDLVCSLRTGGDN